MHPISGTNSAKLQPWKTFLAGIELRLFLKESGLPVALATNRLQGISGYGGVDPRRCCLQHARNPPHLKDNSTPPTLCLHSHCCHAFALARPEFAVLNLVNTSMVYTGPTDEVRRHWKKALHVGMLMRCFLCQEPLPAPDWRASPSARKELYAEWKGHLVSGMSRFNPSSLNHCSQNAAKSFLIPLQTGLSRNTCAPSTWRRPDIMASNGAMTYFGRNNPSPRIGG